MEETTIRIKLYRALRKGEAAQLRGAIASAYPEFGLLHNHDGP